MSMLVIGTPPPELKALIERRKRTGADRHDEVWKGVLHIPPASSHAHGDLQWQLACVLKPLADAAGLKATGEVNVGVDEHNYRVPDGALHRPGASGIWHATAALAIEIVSPGDESWEKLPFYAERNVDEVLIVDAAQGTVVWLALREGEYRPVERSNLIELGAAELAGQLVWP